MRSSNFLLLLVSVLLLLVGFSSQIRHLCREEEGEIYNIKMATLGGISRTPLNQNSLEKEELARFAVQEHNKKQVFGFFSLFKENRGNGKLLSCFWFLGFFFSLLSCFLWKLRIEEFGFLGFCFVLQGMVLCRRTGTSRAFVFLELLRGEDLDGANSGETFSAI